jgi:uncharacterized protein (TIGR02996 family)
MSAGTERGAELLAAVIAAPEDDAPRLAYAAWLTAQGDPRGEYIEAQVRLARFGPNPQRRRELAERVSELDGSMSKAFAADFKKLAFAWKARRGFIDEVSAEAGKLLEDWQPLFAAHPIRALRLSGVEPKHVRALVDAGIVGRLVTLALRGDLGESGVRILAESPDLAGIRNLNLASSSVGDDGLAVLLASPYLACTRLTLRDAEIGDEGAQALAQAPALARCRALFLGNNQLGDDAVAALAGSAHLAGLEQLGLGGNEDITDQGMAPLLAPGVFPRMRLLELEHLSVKRKTGAALRERWGEHVRF